MTWKRQPHPERPQRIEGRCPKCMGGLNLRKATGALVGSFVVCCKNSRCGAFEVLTPPPKRDLHAEVANEMYGDTSKDERAQEEFNLEPGPVKL